MRRDTPLNRGVHATAQIASQLSEKRRSTGCTGTRASNREAHGAKEDVRKAIPRPAGLAESGSLSLSVLPPLCSWAPPLQRTHVAATTASARASTSPGGGCATAAVAPGGRRHRRHERLQRTPSRPQPPRRCRHDPIQQRSPGRRPARPLAVGSGGANRHSGGLGHRQDVKRPRRPPAGWRARQPDPVATPRPPARHQLAELGHSPASRRTSPRVLLLVAAYMGVPKKQPEQSKTGRPRP